MTAAPTTALQAKKRIGGLRRRVYAVLEQGDGVDGIGRALNRFLIALIVVTLAATVVKSVPDLAKTYALPLDAIEWTATLVFSLEYAARLWSAAEHPLLKRAPFRTAPFRAEFSGVGRSCGRFAALVERLVASDFRMLLVLRLVRFFKLTRYSPAMRSLLDALYSERRALGGCFVILLGTALIAAALMHLAERTAQPERFGTIPDALMVGDRDARDDRITGMSSRSPCWDAFWRAYHFRRSAHDGAPGGHFRHRFSSNFSECTSLLDEIPGSWLKPRF